MSQNLMKKIRKIDKILSSIDSIGDVRFETEEIDEINLLTHDIAPRPVSIHRKDYFNSIDAVESVFAVPYAVPHTFYDTNIGRWKCKLENGLGLPLHYEGTGSTEAAARLGAILRLHKNDAAQKMKDNEAA